LVKQSSNFDVEGVAALGADDDRLAESIVKSLGKPGGVDESSATVDRQRQYQQQDGGVGRCESGYTGKG